MRMDGRRRVLTDDEHVRGRTQVRLQIRDGLPARGIAHVEAELCFSADLWRRQLESHTQATGDRLSIAWRQVRHRAKQCSFVVGRHQCALNELWSSTGGEEVSDQHVLT